ncbi:MAG: penicillin-binding protein activator [Candidatus Paceibacterota bacterium]
MSKTILWVIVILIILVGGYFLITAPAQETGPIKIGFIGPLTGELANYGENARAAVEIAVEEINAEGGINGRTLKAVYEDDVCNGPGATNAVNKLINVDKVQAIVGGLCSPATLSVAPIVEKEKVALISYCSTAPDITNAGDYIFRDVPSDLFQGKVAAEYAYNTVGARKAAVVYINNDWGAGLNKSFTEAFEKLGGNVVVSEAYSPESKDLRTQLTKVKSAKADFLYFPAFPDGTTVGIKQIKELKINIPIMGADSWDGAKLWQDIGSYGEGVVFTAAGTNTSDSFKKKMAEKVGSNEIIYCSNYAYDATKIFAKAMSAVGTEGEKIKNALYNIVYTGGVGSSKIEFDQNGDTKEANYFFKTVKNGEIVLMK